VAKPNHNWPRYWIPLGKAVPLDNNGLLYDPEGNNAYFRYSEYQPKLLSQLDQLPVAILLGEPGIGKSTALKEESQRLQTEGAPFAYKELNRYQSDFRLIEDIFNSETMKAWRAGHHHLTLLLDSLDECSLSIPAIVRILVSQFEQLPTNRLTLRLTCRIKMWPSHFAEELKSLWRNEGAVDSFELAPLREKDVLNAAVDNKLDGNAFLAEVRDKEIQPLASHPNTLNMLFSLFGRPSGLPRQRAEIYRLGCELLADESNRFRKEAGYIGSLNARQRMVIAGRIAALMIFTHRSSIWLKDSWMAEAADLTESEIVGGVEHADACNFNIDSHSLHETFGCALFSGRGEGRIGFAHQSYLEFLAAWYLRTCGLHAPRSLPLLLHPDDKRIPPQHIETASWLAAMDKEVFTNLVDTEPLLLLRSDLSDASDEQKAYLAKTLLESFANKAEFNRDWELPPHYRKLAHPHLADQLRPYIIGATFCQSARNEAIEMAGYCRVSELADDLLSVVLNQDDNYYLRISAAHAGIKVTDCAQLAQRYPRILDLISNDPENRIKAALIPSLWPTYFSTKELFELMLKTGDVHCLGWYCYKLEDFAKQFSSDDLCIALQWIIDIGSDLAAYDVNRLKEAIVEETWSRIEDTRLLPAFAKTVWSCIDRYERILNRRGGRAKDLLELNDSKRRMVILALLNVLSVEDNKRNPATLIVGDSQIILSQDADWLLECYRDNPSSALRSRLVACIDYFVRWDADPAWIDSVVSAACAEAPQLESPLADKVALWMEPDWLDSESARQSRKQHEELQKYKRDKPLPLNPPPLVRIENALREFESGKSGNWMQLWQELFLPDDATEYPWNFGNVSKSPGWLRATSQDQSRILLCAATWLASTHLTHAEIFRPDSSTSYSHAATYLALRLLLDVDMRSLEVLPSEKWDIWAAAIITYRFDQDFESRNRLIQFAYEKAPAAVLQTFRAAIDREIANSQSPYIIRELEPIWDTNVVSVLHEYLSKPALTTEQISSFLASLLTHDDETAFMLASKLAQERNNQPLAIAAANELLAKQPQRSWPLVWGEIRNNASFGEELVLGLAYHSHRENNILASLSEMGIADLYLWLEEHFPAENDTRYPSNQAHHVTRRDSAGRLRDSCPSYLSNLGTQAAINALESINAHFPDRDWLKHLLNEARKSFRKSTLRALLPKELVDYTHLRDARLARSSAELMEAVLLSLQRLQVKLQGQTPLAPFLWDEKSGCPKSEDRMSDFLKHHLESDLPTFVIDREVQIRNLREHGIGERTDLKLEAKDQDGRSISVIIESKGCWNKGLLTSMQNQLHERYLKLADDACGIYLVGWFRCERWKDKDDCVFDGTKEDLIVKLNRQAHTLQNENRLAVFVLDATY
jgi:hypothetical protein